MPILDLKCCVGMIYEEKDLVTTKLYVFLR
jgi:hypothetical protein